MKQQLIDYRKEHPEHRVLMGVVLGLIDQIQNPTDRDCQLTIRKMVKDNNESIENATAKIGEESHRKDSKTYEQIIEELKAENEVLEAFLPTQMSEESIKAILMEKNFATMGECMKYFKKTYEGVYDGSLVSSIYKKLVA